RSRWWPLPPLRFRVDGPRLPIRDVGRQSLRDAPPRLKSCRGTFSCPSILFLPKGVQWLDLRRCAAAFFHIARVQSSCRTPKPRVPSFGRRWFDCAPVPRQVSLPTHALGTLCFSTGCTDFCTHRAGGRAYTRRHLFHVGARPIE